MTRTIDRTRIEKRIREIDRRLRFLRKLAGTDVQTYKANHSTASTIERDLEITIQACLDIADHIISGLGLEIPKKDRKETFEILAINGIVPKPLVRHLTAMAGQRNILIHEYLEVDPEEILKTVREDLGDIVTYVSHIQQFLDKTFLDNTTKPFTREFSDEEIEEWKKEDT